MINPVMKCPVNHSIVVISPPRLLGFLFQITIELISMAFQLNTNTKDQRVNYCAVSQALVMLMMKAPHNTLTFQLNTPT